MKGNLIKAGIAIAAAVIIIAVVAALVTGYMSAFKPKNNTTSSASGYSGGGGVRGGGGVSAAVITPTPPPGAMPRPGEMPPQPMQSPQMPSQPLPAVPMQPPSQQAMGPNPYLYNAVPSQQGEPTSPQAGGSPGFTGASPLFGNRGGSWFNIAPPVNATPVAIPAPVTARPIAAPVKSPAEQEFPTYGLTPYEYGWRQVILRLLQVIPLLFPGYYPGLQWYTMPSAY